MDLKTKGEAKTNRHNINIYIGAKPAEEPVQSKEMMEVNSYKIANSI